MKCIHSVRLTVPYTVTELETTHGDDSIQNLSTAHKTVCDVVLISYHHTLSRKTKQKIPLHSLTPLFPHLLNPQFPNCF